MRNWAMIKGKRNWIAKSTCEVFKPALTWQNSKHFMFCVIRNNLESSPEAAKQSAPWVASAIKLFFLLRFPHHLADWHELLKQTNKKKEIKNQLSCIEATDLMFYLHNKLFQDWMRWFNKSQRLPWTNFRAI